MRNITLGESWNGYYVARKACNCQEGGRGHSDIAGPDFNYGAYIRMATLLDHHVENGEKGR
jgi:hypothetical protein